MKFANLHIHSIFSDGLSGTGELAARIYAEPGLCCFALTDHDTLSGIEPMFRAKCLLEGAMDVQPRTFIPGVELSLAEPETAMTVHLLGYFPWMTEDNHREKLSELDRVLGAYCVARTLRRGVRDLDERVRCAWEMDLDGLSGLFESAGEVIAEVRAAAAREAARVFSREGKNGDVILHPIPVTYQSLVDCWEALVPGSTRARIINYVLRRDRSRINELASLYRDAGVPDGRAAMLAEERQGVLSRCLGPPSGDMTIMEGLAALKKTGAVTVLAHPAVDHHRFGYRTVDDLVVKPLADAGLDGIEAFYPYDESYRNEAVDHYLGTAQRLGLLVSGGTDYHGDGRTGLRDVELPPEHAERILRSGGESRETPQGRQTLRGSGKR